MEEEVLIVFQICRAHDEVTYMNYKMSKLKKIVENLKKAIILIKFLKEDLV